VNRRAGNKPIFHQPETQSGTMIARTKIFLTLLTIVFLAGCLTPGGMPPPQQELYSPTQLKYILLDHYGEDNFFFCDPDYYPVSHGDELEKAIQTFPAIQNNTEEFIAIVGRKGLEPPYSDESKLIVYREYKKLNAIQLTPATNDTYDFSLEIQTIEGGRRVTGIIRDDGVILERHSEEAVLTCPICLAKGTLIDTPEGPVPVEKLKEGMSVWTQDADGNRKAVPVLRTSMTPVRQDHPVVHLRLSDGRELFASPGHPTMDNRTIGSLQIGDRMDGAAVTAADTIPYHGGSTHDLLPAGDTGSYRANGVLLRSTLV
jgi:hypothetical protein